MQRSVFLKPAFFLALVLSGLGLSHFAHADIYALVDEDGSVRLSNVPDDPRYKLYLKEADDYKLKDPGTRINLRDSSPYRLSGLKSKELQLSLSSRPYRDHVLEAAKLHNIDPALVHAVIQVESAYNFKAVSPKGAVGLMQLMPATGLRYGLSAKQLRSPADNIRAGTRYLAELLKMFGGDVKLALAGYNAGEGAVLKYGNRIPPYRETQAYVPRVLAFYERWRTE